MSPPHPADGLILDFDIFPVAGNNTRISATATLGNSGVWRSNDEGANWTQQISGTTYRGTAIKPGDNQTVLAGEEGGQVQRTTDGGGMWAVTNSGTYDTWFFAFSNSTPTTVYAGGSTGGLPPDGIFLKSTDSGGTWNSFAIDIDATPLINSVTSHPTNEDIVYVGAQSTMMGFNDGLYRSVDGGTSFTHLSNLPLTLVNAVTVDPNDGNLVYAGTVNSGTIYRSTDGGDNWSIIHDQLSDVAGFAGLTSIAIDRDDSRIIYAVGGFGASPVIVSTDCGSTWTDADPLNQLPAGFAPTRAEIDNSNDFIYVLVATLLYREAQQTTASGSCPVGTAPGGGANPGDVGAGGGGGGNAGGDSAGGSGSGGSSIDYFLVILGFLLLGWQILGRNSGFGRSGA